MSERPPSPRPSPPGEGEPSAATRYGGASSCSAGARLSRAAARPLATDALGFARTFLRVRAGCGSGDPRAFALLTRPLPGRVRQWRGPVPWRAWPLGVEPNPSGSPGVSPHPLPRRNKRHLNFDPHPPLRAIRSHPRGEGNPTARGGEGSSCGNGTFSSAGGSTRFASRRMTRAGCGRTRDALPRSGPRWPARGRCPFPWSWPARN